MISRSRWVESVERLLRQFPVVAILGPRQVGKSTLARLVAKAHGRSTFFDLERAPDLARLADAHFALEPLRGLVVLDEVQRRPDLFAALRVLADRPRRPAQFLVLGSAAPHLLRQSSETLAGRIAYVELPGFSLDEVGAAHADRLWLRGGFPPSYLARTDGVSATWRRQFVRTFLERDVPALGIRVPSPTLDRFWKMLAHWHGQLWNASELGRSLGVSDGTVRNYLADLESTFVVRVLRPFHENLAKRQVKMPKVYVADSGMLHALLGIRDRTDLEVHPKLGASWEGFALREVVARLGAESDECFFWRTANGAELDLLVARGRHRLGFEFKRTSSPTPTPSMHIALADLRLDRLDVIHAGAETFPLAPRIRAVALRRLLDDVR